jgi:mannose-6-phosphate isomerase-like protein (cupin superfamily)
MLRVDVREDRGGCMNLTTTQLQQFVTELAATPDLWRHLVRHRSDARVYEQIWEEHAVNAWLICWSEDQDTGFHDHDESDAAIRVIAGRVRDERLRLNGAPHARVIGPGATFFVPPSAIHRVLHTGGVPAVTIHAYSPPLRRTGVYRIGPDGELERAVQSYEHELRAEPALS